MSGLRAVCTWGVGPDVLLVNDSKGYLIYENPHEITHENRESYGGSIYLTAHEARELAVQLIASAEFADEYERSVEYYFGKDNHKELDKLCKI